MNCEIQRNRADGFFDWSEAERLAALPDFRVSDRLAVLKEEVSRA